MSTALKENPYKKLEYINSLAASGMTRKEIAEQLGYKDVKNLYAFTFRHGMEWSDKKGLYVVKGTNIEAQEVVEDTPTGKVGSIISMFEKKVDGKEIAKRLRFASYQEMADYMKSRGYIWDNQRQNYKKSIVEDNSEPKEAQQETEITQAKSSGLLEEYTDILKLLKENKDKLAELFQKVEVEKASIPRYSLPGYTTPKSLSMTNTLERLIKEFSEDKNISQKEIIEVAVVEFLKKYGYSEQVKAVLYV